MVSQPLEILHTAIDHTHPRHVLTCSLCTLHSCFTFALGNFLFSQANPPQNLLNELARSATPAVMKSIPNFLPRRHRRNCYLRISNGIEFLYFLCNFLSQTLVRLSDIFFFCFQFFKFFPFIQSSQSCSTCSLCTLHSCWTFSLKFSILQGKRPQNLLNEPARSATASAPLEINSIRNSVPRRHRRNSSISNGIQFLYFLRNFRIPNGIQSNLLFMFLPVFIWNLSRKLFVSSCVIAKKSANSILTFGQNTLFLFSLFARNVTTPTGDLTHPSQPSPRHVPHVLFMYTLQLFHFCFRKFSVSQ